MKLEDYLEGNLVSTFDEMVNELRLVCSMDEKFQKNEFGEKVEAITDTNDYRLSQINKICRDLQINPFEDGPKVDRIKVSSLESVNDGDHYVLTVYGGANGGGGDKKWQDYFMLIRKFFAAISEKFHTRVWMVDWKNDCADDVWYLRLGFDDNKEKEAAIEESEMVEVEDGCKELDRLKQMVRMRKISKSDFKTGLAGLYAAGLITMNQFDVAKRQFR